MKPTSGRIYEGGRVYTVRPGVGSNAGFMCRKVEGVTTAMKALLQDAKIMSMEGKIDIIKDVIVGDIGYGHFCCPTSKG